QRDTPSTAASASGCHAGLRSNRRGHASPRTSLSQARLVLFRAGQFADLVCTGCQGDIAGPDRGDTAILCRAAECDAARRTVGGEGPLPEARTNRAPPVRRAVYGKVIDRTFLGQTGG